jgi:hypothetical protein
MAACSLKPYFRGVGKNELINEGHAKAHFAALFPKQSEASIYPTARRKKGPLVPLSKYARLFQLQTSVLTPEYGRRR